MRDASVQTYPPMQVAPWIQTEARRSRRSRSQWIGAIVFSLFHGQQLRKERRQIFASIGPRLNFIACALDGVHAEHPDRSPPARGHDPAGWPVRDSSAEKGA